MHPFPSIEQFRNVIHHVNHYSYAKYGICDEEGQLLSMSQQIKTWKNPTLKFTGTVKLHGTNAGIIVDTIYDTVSFQSRSRDLTLTSDNAGFAAWAMQKSHQQFWHNIAHHFQNVYEKHRMIEDDLEQIVIFGEWCGENIQKNVAISQLPKMFVIFGIQHRSSGYWFNPQEIKEQMSGISYPKGVYDIYQFSTYEMDIDFENPHLSQNELANITNQVEK